MQTSKNINLYSPNIVVDGCFIAITSVIMVALNLNTNVIVRLCKKVIFTCCSILFVSMFTHQLLLPIDAVLNKCTIHVGVRLKTDNG